MRDLSGTLLEAEQQKASYTPYVRVYLPNLNVEFHTYFVASGDFDQCWPGRWIARKSDGTLSLVYCKYFEIPDRWETHVIYSTDNGVTWGDDEMVPLHEDVDETEGGTINIDSEDNIHVIYKMGENLSNLYHVKKTSLGWGDPVFVMGSQYNKRSWAADIDSEDALHVLTPYQDRKVYYRNSTSGGAWGSVETLFTPDSLSFSLAANINADPDDVIHALWTGDSYVCRRRKVAGEWQDLEQLAATGSASTSSTAIDTDGNLHIATLHTLDTDKLDYRRFTNGEAETIVEGMMYDPCPSIDRNGRVHLIWIDPSDWTMRYRRRNGSWSSISSLVGDIDATQTTLLHHLYPVIGGESTNIPRSGFAGAIIVWNEETELQEIRFFKSTGIVW